jgi:hypothetical protein
MTNVAVEHAAAQAPLESVIKGEVLRMYQEVADHPERNSISTTGVPQPKCSATSAIGSIARRRGPASFVGVGNPHLRSRLQPGETVLDLGAARVLDNIIARSQVGPTGA